MVRGSSEAEALDNTTDVETPERVRFRYRVAGPVRRALAYLLDLVLRAIVMLLLSLLGIPLGFTASKVTAGLWMLLLFAMEWGWNVAFETLWRGQTPGKRALRLRVVKEGGYPVGFIDSVLRNLMRAADFLPVGYLVGLLVMAGDGRFRRLGDRVAGTMVVEEDRAGVSTPVTLTPPATADELGALPHRLPLSPDELDAIELFLRRGAALRRAPDRAGRVGGADAGQANWRPRQRSRAAARLALPAAPGPRRAPVGAARGRAAMIETQDAFVARRRAEWDELDALLATDRAWHKQSGAAIARAASLYRSVSADLMRARSMGFSPDLTAHLDGLAARAHAALYSAPPYRLGAIGDFLTRDFPRTVRRYRWFVAFATFLFLMPAVVGFVGARALAHVRAADPARGGRRPRRGELRTRSQRGPRHERQRVHGRVLRLQQRRDRLPLLRDRHPVRPGQRVLPGLQRPHPGRGLGVGVGGRPRAEPADVGVRPRRVRADRDRHLGRGGHGHGLRAGRHRGPDADGVAARAGARSGDPGAGRGRDVAVRGGHRGVLVAVARVERREAGRRRRTLAVRVLVPGARRSRRSATGVRRPRRSRARRRTCPRGPRGPGCGAHDLGTRDDDGVSGTGRG